MATETSRKPHRSRKFGGGAIEFALTLPVLMSFVFGIGDYGWYYFQHSLISHGLIAAARVGAMTRPADSEQGMGTCAACISNTQQAAITNLAKLGITVTKSQVTPTIQNVGGACMLTLEPDLPAQSLFGFVPVPHSYTFDIVVAAQSVTGC